MKICIVIQITITWRLGRHVRNMFKTQMFKILNCQMSSNNIEYTYLCTDSISVKTTSENLSLFLISWQTRWVSQAEFTNCSLLHLSFLLTLKERKGEQLCSISMCIYFRREIIKSPLKATEMPLVKVPLWKDTRKHKSFPSALEIGVYR